MTKEAKCVINIFLNAPLPFLILYTAGALASWDFNPANWEPFLRGVCAFLAVSWWVATMVYIYEKMGIDDK